MTNSVSQLPRLGTAAHGVSGVDDARYPHLGGAARRDVGRHERCDDPAREEGLEEPAVDVEGEVEHGPEHGEW